MNAIIETLRMAAILTIFVIGAALVVIELSFVPGPDSQESE